MCVILFCICYKCYFLRLSIVVVIVLYVNGKKKKLLCYFLFRKINKIKIATNEIAFKSIKITVWMTVAQGFPTFLTDIS